MIFRPYYRFETGCASYLFGCGSLGSCAVVDPHHADIAEYETFAAAKGMRITHVIDTHVHADHCSGGVVLAERTGAAYCLHESAEVDFPFQALKHDQEIVLGNTRARVIHTPGHTPESICVLVADQRRAVEPWFVLTGDTLFVGSVGRPDLPGRAKENAKQLYESIHQRLLTLAGEIELYPGHFSGSACGAGMSGKPSSTIAFERRNSPLLALSQDDFIAQVCNVPIKSEAMEAILSFNRSGRENV